MRRPHRPITATLLAAGCACALAACGSSSSSGSGATSGAKGPGAGGRRVGVALTASERSCLKQKGVTFTGGPGAGAGRPGAKGLKRGTPPAGARKRFTPGAGGAVPARFKKQQAALKACGVTIPTGGGAPGAGAPGGGPGGAPAD